MASFSWASGVVPNRPRNRPLEAFAPPVSEGEEEPGSDSSSVARRAGMVKLESLRPV
jgi:hypothetical protein